MVVGYSTPSAGFPSHAFRSVNGALLQFIPEPPGLAVSSGCLVLAVDSSGTLLLSCEGSSFLYTTAGGAVAVDLSPISGGASVNDLSLDGKVIVGFASFQAFRKANGVTTLLGPLAPGGANDAAATNGDGSVVVGLDGMSPTIAMRWTPATGSVGSQRWAAIRPPQRMT